jgi:phosphatidylglycerophosphate synthase
LDGRYKLAAAANLSAAAAFTALAARRLGGPVLTGPNLLTLSRVGAAAMLCGTAFSGRGRRAAFWALLAGCTVLDWLDGPLARRLGTSSLGAVLDIEADSWLTLWGAVAAFRLGRLPGASLVPPALRYPLVAGRPTRMRPWQRAAGAAQMVVIAGALALRRPARALAGAVAMVQMGALVAGAVGYAAAHGPTAHDVPSPRLGDAQADRSLREPAP